MQKKILLCVPNPIFNIIKSQQKIPKQTAKYPCYPKTFTIHL